MAQAFYILVWNHPEGVKDSDLCTPYKEGKAREALLKEELSSYYKIFSPIKDKQMGIPDYYKEQVEKFCAVDEYAKRNTARSRIKKAFIERETKRVHELYAKKVASYFSFDAKEGIIKVGNRNSVIDLPDSLKGSAI